MITGCYGGDVQQADRLLIVALAVTYLKIQYDPSCQWVGTDYGSDKSEVPIRMIQSESLLLLH